MSDKLPPIRLTDASEFTHDAKVVGYADAREAVRAAVERERAKYEADYRVHERAKRRATELEEELTMAQAKAELPDQVRAAVDEHTKVEKGLEPIAQSPDWYDMAWETAPTEEAGWSVVADLLADYRKLYAHPPTSEWNDAIEAALNAYYDSAEKDYEAMLLALKREPR